MKILIETGNDSHTTSWQKMQALYVEGPHKDKPLFTDKQAVLDKSWLENSKHVSLVKTVYQLPEGTEILIDYKSWQGVEKFIIKLDSTQDVQVREIGVGNLRTYTLKGRFIVVRDLQKELEQKKLEIHNEDF